MKKFSFFRSCHSSCHPGLVQCGIDWHLAVAPLEVARALGNLYTAQYLNPPLSPMLIIDREGNVHHLEYELKKKLKHCKRLLSLTSQNNSFRNG